MYKLTETNSILRIADGAQIPCDPDNSDYARYLAWLDEGNEPQSCFTEEELAAKAAIPARILRDAELARSDIQLLKIQDGDTKLGTQKAWRDYRNALRDWPSTDSFPEVMPDAPDTK